MFLSNCSLKSWLNLVGVLFLLIFTQSKVSAIPSISEPADPPSSNLEGSPLEQDFPLIQEPLDSILQISPPIPENRTNSYLNEQQTIPV
jgi:hypothetical protein